VDQRRGEHDVNHVNEHTLIYYNTDYRLEHWMCDLDMDIDTILSFTRHVLIQKYFVFSHAFVIMFTLSISLLLLHFNISSGMNSVSDTCKLSYSMIIKLLVCNSTAALAYMIKFFY
jgi:hypothetical protein